jgi:hypothetical protein
MSSKSFTQKLYTVMRSVFHVVYKFEGVFKSFRTKSITKYTLTEINTRSEATQRVMAAKLTRLTHKIATQLHLVSQSCYNLQFSFQASSPETFGYTLVLPYD